VRAAIDRGSAATLQVGLSFRTDSPFDQPDFTFAGLSPIDPNTGLVEKCVFSYQLGVPPIPPTTFAGPFQYFWTVAFSVSGASDEIQSDLVTVSLGPELQEIQTPTVFSSGCQ
jgi:hypothetical protein